MGRAVSVAWMIVLGVVAMAAWTPTAGAADVGDAAREALTAARQAAEQIQDPEHRDSLLRQIAVAQAEAGDPAALQTALAMVDAENRNWALSNVAKVQVRAGNLPAALQAAAAPGEPEQQDRIHHTIVFELALAGRYEDAEQTLRKFKTAAAQTTAAAAYAGARAQQGDVEVARELLRDLEEPTAHSRSFVLKNIAEAQLEAGDADGAAATLQALLDLMDAVATANDKGIVAERAVEVMTAVGRLDAALQLSEGLPAGYHKAFCLTKCAEAQAEQGDLDAALATVQGMGDPLRVQRALEDLVESRLAAGDPEGATTVARKLTNELRNRNGAFCDIAINLAEAGDVKAALTTAEQISKGAAAFDSVGRALAHIALAQARAGEPEPAGRTFERAWQFVGAIKVAVRSKSEALADLIEILARTGDIASARQSAEVMDIATDRAAAQLGLARGMLHPADPPTPIAFVADAPPSESPPARAGGRMTLSDFMDLQPVERLELAQKKVLQVLALLKSPTDQQGRPKPDPVRQTHLKAFALLAPYFTQPLKAGESHPYLVLMQGMEAVYYEKDAYADVDQLVLAHVDHVLKQLVQAKQAEQSGAAPSP